MQRLYVFSLPSLKEQVEQLLESCVRDIDALPPGLSQEPQVEVLLRVSKFCTGVSEMIEAKVTKEFVQRNRDSYRSFKLAIKDAGPDFRPYSKTWTLARPAFACEEPDDDDEAMLSAHEEDGTRPDDTSRSGDMPVWEFEPEREFIVSPIHPSPMRARSCAPTSVLPVPVVHEVLPTSTGIGPLSLEDIRRAITK